MYETIVTAYHEAGHATAAWLWFEHPFEWITVVPDGDLLGNTHFGHHEWCRRCQTLPPYEEMERLLERDVMVGWAGPIAERLYRGSTLAQERRRCLDVFEDREFTKHIELAERLRLNDINHDFEVLRQRTLDRIEESWSFWPTVERLAAALLEHRTLTWN